MVGLNHELASELLWREFPSDMRHTYFRQLLGHARHAAPMPAAADPRVDPAAGLGEPLRAAARAARAADPRRAAAPLPGRADLRRQGARRPTTLGTEEKLPLFRGRIDPDITFLGFDLTERAGRRATRLVLRDPGAADRAALRARRHARAARSTPGTTSRGATSRTAPGAHAADRRDVMPPTRARPAPRGRSTARTWPRSCASARCGSRSTRRRLLPK